MVIILVGIKNSLYSRVDNFESCTFFYNTMPYEEMLSNVSGDVVTEASTMPNTIATLTKRMYNVTKASVPTIRRPLELIGFSSSRMK